MPNCVILANYLAYYKILLFSEILKENSSLKIIYIAKSDTRREWRIRKDEIDYPFEIMFQRPADDVPKGLLFKRTWSRLNELNPDVVIIDGYSYASCWGGFLWAKINAKRIILWSGSNEHDRVRKLYKELIKGLFVRGCDCYNVYGSRSRDYLIKLGAKEDKASIIGNSTDNNYFRHETEKWRQDRGILCRKHRISGRNFIYIGRFSEEKNILSLLEAYRRLEKEGTRGWGLILVGSGPQEDEIKCYISQIPT